MGTRINVLLEHNLPNVSNREAVLLRLAGALPAALAVREYWQTTDKHYPGQRYPNSSLTMWRAEPTVPALSGLHRYTAPGSLLVTLAAQAATIHTGGRWSGFMTIEPLRRVHLAAFREIAKCLGSQGMALYADSCEVNDLFWGGKSFWDCTQEMEKMLGRPQASIDEIDPAVEAKGNIYSVWFLESTAPPLEIANR